MKNTEADELYTALRHLDNARKAMLRTGWTATRDSTQAELDRVYRKVQIAAKLAADAERVAAAKEDTGPRTWVVHGSGDDVKGNIIATNEVEAVALVGRLLDLPTEHWWARPNEAAAL